MLINVNKNINLKLEYAWAWEKYYYWCTSVLVVGGILKLIIKNYVEDKYYHLCHSWSGWDSFWINSFSYKILGSLCYLTGTDQSVEKWKTIEEKISTLSSKKRRSAHIFTRAQKLTTAILPLKNYPKNHMSDSQKIAICISQVCGHAKSYFQHLRYDKRAYFYFWKNIFSHISYKMTRPFRKSPKYKKNRFKIKIPENPTISCL